MRRSIKNPKTINVSREGREELQLSIMATWFVLKGMATLAFVGVTLTSPIRAMDEENKLL